MTDDRWAKTSGVELRVRESVLLVEDDPESREMLAIVLRESGADVTTLGRADEALAVIAANTPDVVIIDLGLPGTMSGADLALRLRADVATMHIGLVAVSGSLEPQWPGVCPVDAYLRKPIDYELLIDLVATVTDSVRASRTRSKNATSR